MAIPDQDLDSRRMWRRLQLRRQPTRPAELRKMGEGWPVHSQPWLYARRVRGGVPELLECLGVETEWAVDGCAEWGMRGCGRAAHSRSGVRLELAAGKARIIYLINSSSLSLGFLLFRAS